jgi:hypothetical protein
MKESRILLFREAFYDVLLKSDIVKGKGMSMRRVIDWRREVLPPKKSRRTV